MVRSIVRWVVTVMLTASPVLGKCPAPCETKWGQMTCADESWPRDMLGRAGHPSQCYDGLAAGQKCRQRVSEMLETRDDSNDRILHEVSRESRDPERPAGDDEERAAGHSRQMWRVRHHYIQDRESVLISRARRGQRRRPEIVNSRIHTRTEAPTAQRHTDVRTSADRKDGLVRPTSGHWLLHGRGGTRLGTPCLRPDAGGPVVVPDSLQRSHF